MCAAERLVYECMTTEGRTDIPERMEPWTMLMRPSLTRGLLEGIHSIVFGKFQVKKVVRGKVSHRKGGGGTGGTRGPFSPTTRGWRCIICVLLYDL